MKKSLTASFLGTALLVSVIGETSAQSGDEFLPDWPDLSGFWQMPYHPSWVNRECLGPLQQGCLLNQQVMYGRDFLELKIDIRHPSGGVEIGQLHTPWDVRESDTSKALRIHYTGTYHHFHGYGEFTDFTQHFFDILHVEHLIYEVTGLLTVILEGSVRADLSLHGAFDATGEIPRFPHPAEFSIFNARANPVDMPTFLAPLELFSESPVPTITTYMNFYGEVTSSSEPEAPGGWRTLWDPSISVEIGGFISGSVVPFTRVGSPEEIRVPIKGVVRPKLNPETISRGHVNLYGQSQFSRQRRTDETEEDYRAFLRGISTKISSTKLDEEGNFAFWDVPLGLVEQGGFQVSRYMLEVTSAEADVDENVFDQATIYFRPSSQPNVLAGDYVEFLLDGLPEIGMKRSLAERLIKLSPEHFQPAEQPVLDYLDGVADTPLEGTTLEAIRRGIWAERIVLEGAQSAQDMINKASEALAQIIGDVFEDKFGTSTKEVEQAKNFRKAKRNSSQTEVNEMLHSEFNLDINDVWEQENYLSEIARQSQFFDLLKALSKTFVKAVGAWASKAGADEETVSDIVELTQFIMRTVISSLQAMADLESWRGAAKPAVKKIIEETVKAASNAAASRWVMSDFEEYLAEVSSQILAWNTFDPEAYFTDAERTSAIHLQMVEEVVAGIRVNEYAKAFAQTGDTAQDLFELIEYIPAGRYATQGSILVKYLSNVGAAGWPLWLALDDIPEYTEEGIAAAFGQETLISPQEADSSMQQFVQVKSLDEEEAPFPTGVHERLTASLQAAAESLEQFWGSLAENRLGDAVDQFFGPDQGRVTTAMDKCLERLMQFIQQAAETQTSALHSAQPEQLHTMMLETAEFAERWRQVRFLFVNLLIDLANGSFEGAKDPAFLLRRHELVELTKYLVVNLLNSNEKTDALVESLSDSTFVPLVVFEDVSLGPVDAAPGILTTSPVNLILQAKVRNLSSVELTGMSAKAEFVALSEDAQFTSAEVILVGSGRLSADDGIEGTGTDEVMVDWKIAFTGTPSPGALLIRLSLLEQDDEPVHFATSEALAAAHWQVSAYDPDEDSLPSEYEREYQLDPLTPDSELDPDADELSSLKEYQLGTNPRQADTDEDGLPDGEEVSFGQDGFLTDPLTADSDGDGVDDGADGNPLDGSTQASPPDVEPKFVNIDPHEVFLSEGEPLGFITLTDSDGEPATVRSYVDDPAVAQVLPAGTDQTATGFLSIQVPSGYDFSIPGKTRAFIISVDPEFDRTPHEFIIRVGDSDDDLIVDVWELQHFDNLTTADANSDWDGDGLTDLEEFRNGTDPKKSFVVEEIQLSPKDIQIILGTLGNTVELMISARYTDNTIADVSRAMVLFDSSDESVATVNAVGEVSGIGAGSATITVHYGNLEDSLVVHVESIANVIEDLKLPQGNRQIVKGESIELILSAKVSGGIIADISPHLVTFSTNDETVATVDAIGVVTGVGVGSAIITANYEGFEDSILVNITPEVIQQVPGILARASDIPDFHSFDNIYLNNGHAIFDYHAPFGTRYTAAAVQGEAGVWSVNYKFLKAGNSMPGTEVALESGYNAFPVRGQGSTDVMVRVANSFQAALYRVPMNGSAQRIIGPGDSIAGSVPITSPGNFPTPANGQFIAGLASLENGDRLIWRHDAETGQTLPVHTIAQEAGQLYVNIADVSSDGKVFYSVRTDLSTPGQTWVGDGSGESHIFTTLSEELIAISDILCNRQNQCFFIGSYASSGNSLAGWCTVSGELLSLVESDFTGLSGCGSQWGSAHGPGGNFWVPIGGEPRSISACEVGLTQRFDPYSAAVLCDGFPGEPGNKDDQLVWNWKRPPGTSPDDTMEVREFTDIVLGGQTWHIDLGTVDFGFDATGFAVRAVLDDEEVIFHAQAAPQPPPDDVPPSPPANLTATEVGSRHVTLSWNSATDEGSGIRQYQILRDGQPIVTVSGESQEHTDTSARPEQNYNYQVIALDQAYNPSEPSNTTMVSTVADVISRGFVLEEKFNDISGNNVENLTSSEKFIAGTPDEINYRTDVDAGDRGQDNFGVRWTGYAIPGITGPYHFFDNSDDQSELEFSMDGNPDNRQLIAREPQWNGFRQWQSTDRRNTEAPENQSSTLFPNGLDLVAGQIYSFSALMKEGGGGDNLSITWQAPGEVLPVNGEPSRIQQGNLAAPADPIGAFVTISQHPADLTVEANQSAAFSVQFECDWWLQGTPPPSYIQWRVNETEITGANGRTLTIPTVQDANAGTYSVTIFIPGAEATSVSAMLTVLKDVTPAQIIAVDGSSTFENLDLKFNEPVDPGSATDPSRYNIEGLEVFEAIRTAPNGIRLTTSRQTPGTTYTLAIDDLLDNAGNATQANVDFKTYDITPGFALWNRINNIPGVNPDDVLNHSKFPDNPDHIEIVPKMEAPLNDGDNYGGWLEGQVRVAATGWYDFFMASDDGGRTSLSTDDGAANLKPIAYEPVWVSFRDYTGTGNRNAAAPENRSTTLFPDGIFLNAGSSYFMRAVMSEGSGGDHLSVAIAPHGEFPTGPMQSEIGIPLPPNIPSEASASPILIHRWSFNESGGTTAFDSVGEMDGNIWNGTLSNGEAILDNSSGITSGDPNGAFVAFPPGILTQLNSFTMETWVTPSPDEPGTPWARIVDFGNNDGSNGTESLFLRAGAGNETIRGTAVVPGGKDRVLTCGKLNLGEENHVVFTMDGDTGRAGIYLNGDLVGFNYFRLTPSELGPTANNWLGRSQWSQDPYWNGSLNECRIYDQALTTDQVLANLNAGPEMVSEEFEALEWDFGDAPVTADSLIPDLPFGYPTTGPNAARHAMVQGVRLGGLNDAEEDGQPTSMANGDDLADSDDEDGIKFLMPVKLVRGIEIPVLEIGGSGHLEAEMTLPTPMLEGVLNGWIDYNRDGDWGDVGEQIIENFTTAPPGIQMTFDFTAPTEAGEGLTFARFRYSGNTGLGPTGPADEGEVEDYVIEMVPSGSLLINRQPPSQIVDLGSGENPTARFEVLTVGENLTFQWFRNAVAIAGATGKVLEISNVQIADVGVYTVEVSDGERTELSSPASLQISNDPDGPLALDNFSELYALAGPSIPAPVQAAFAKGPGSLSKAFASVASGSIGTQIFSTFGATMEENEPPHCKISGGASYWFAYQAPVDGQLSLDTNGSNFDTVMAVYLSTDGNLVNLQQVACDNNSGKDGQDSAVTFEATAGTIYYIAVDGADGATGIVHLNYTLAIIITFANPAISDTGEFSVDLSVPPNREFVLEFSEDLKTWSTLKTDMSPNGFFKFSDPDFTATRIRFLRAFILIE